jgi:hypothetical protein
MNERRGKRWPARRRAVMMSQSDWADVKSALDNATLLPVCRKSSLTPVSYLDTVGIRAGPHGVSRVCRRRF